MMKNRLKNEAIRIADKKIYEVSDFVHTKLRDYANSHRVTGELFENINMTKVGEVGYRIDGGTRSNYSNNQYHPITFFVNKEANQFLNDLLIEARGKFKKGE